jgi:hypothetical protein
MYWAWHVACMAEMRTAYKILFEKPERKKNSEDLDANGRIILTWMPGK